MRRVYSILFFSVSTLLMTSCSEQAGENVDKDQSQENVEHSDAESTTSVSEDWFEFYGVEASVFDKEAKDMGLPEIEPYYLEEDDFYRNVAFYSPDENHYVDMDSYGMELFRNDEGEIEYMGREVDVKAYISTVKNLDSAAVRLVMCGTSCLPEAAIWKDNENVWVVGRSRNEETEKDHPTVWTYNVKNGAFGQIIADEPFKDQEKSFFNEVRLPKIKSTAAEKM